MRYSFYIGRFQPFHGGHKWCIQQMINNNKKVCIAVMDIHESEPEKNPYTYEEVLRKISDELKTEIENGQVRVMKIPPVESVNYGRDVGYDFIEHTPPDEVRQISATKIRERNES
tara:strand:+ start:4416 stop:4760 length:345 start_codon:yes stop_codon:yes gene_type:complete